MMPSEQFMRHHYGPSGYVSENAPIRLNDEQEEAVKSWAMDDRLWTTQETVEHNLRLFARVILKAVARLER